MLRILHVDTASELRGGQWQILTLAKGLSQRGHEQVIATPANSPLEERAKLCGLETFPFPSSSARNWRFILLLRRLILQRLFQVVHAHDGRGQTLSWLASLGLPARRVASRRVAFAPNRLLHGAKYRLTCDAAIAVSGFVQRLLIECGVPSDRIAVIPDGIEIPATLPKGSDREALRTAWRLEDEDFVIGQMGSFTAEKGQDVAVEAIRLLSRRLPRITLLLAGHGPGRPALEQECQASKAADVRFLGWIEDLDQFFTGLDLFIMPSRSEGLGSSALLAMAYGLPVIGSRTGGLAEIIDEERTGWLVQPSEPEELARAIEHAISRREELKTMGQAARKKAREFSSEILTAKTEALYLRLLGRDSSLAGSSISSSLYQSR